MKKIKLLLLFVFIMITQIGNSQIDANKITYLRGKVYYQNEFYSPKEIEQFVKLDELAYKHYKKFHNLNRGAAAFGFLSAGLLVGGYAMVSYDREDSDYINCDDFCPDEFIQFVGRPVLVFGAVSGIVAIIKGSRSKKFLIKSIDTFNEGNVKHLGQNKSPIIFDIGTTSTGIGLVVNF